MLEQNLINTVKASLERAETKEQIYQSLLAQGHTVQDITDSLEVAGLAGGKVEAQKRSVFAVVIIGAILVGAGIFSFIASNWEFFGRPLKVAIIVISMSLSYAAGWYVKEIKTFKRTGNTLIILGSVIYGAGIFLVAEMFQIKANFPDGFLIWMLGIMLLAFFMDFSGLLYFAVVLGIISVWSYCYVILESLPGHSQLLFTSTILLFLTTVFCFAQARYFRKKIVFKEDDIY